LYKSLKKKTAVATILLSILALSVLPANLLFAKADPVGVGKYLTVEIVGDGNVTATKVNSGEVWYYYPTDPATEHKLGAGTVSVEAYANDGWEFSHWEQDLTGTANPTYYKSEKYGTIRAVFVKKTFTINAYVASEAPYGYLETTINDVPTQIYDQLAITVGYGDDQNFIFHPDSGNHVSAIQVDNTFVPYTMNYEFSNVQKDWTLTVFFSADGEAYVPQGTNVPVYLGDAVSLNFTSITVGGTANQNEIELPALLVGTSLLLWEFNLAGVSFDGIVEIGLPYAGVQNLTAVFASDSLDALYCDVNGDGIVDGDDVSDVAVGIKTTVASGAIYDPQFDVNRDEELTEDDVHLVNQFKGTTLESLTFWVENGILYIETGHFSIFRGR
jgi:hypothetical protein